MGKHEPMFVVLIPPPGLLRELGSYASATLAGLHELPGHHLLLPTVLIMSAAVKQDSFHRAYYYNLVSNGNHPPELRHTAWVCTRKLPKLASILQSVWTLGLSNDSNVAEYWA